MSRLRTLATVACVLPFLAFVVGCYETQYPLGSADKAVVDPGYVGDFTSADDQGKSETIMIRNIDDRQYYVEYIPADDKDKILRMVGYTADVNGATFANLRGLTDDGSIDKSYMIFRIELSPDHSKLTLRSLKDDFFKDKKIDSTDAQTKVIADNLNEDAMYDGPPSTWTRVPAPSTQK
jgi:hypothetical protein